MNSHRWWFVIIGLFCWIFLSIPWLYISKVFWTNTIGNKIGGLKLS